MTTLDRLQLVVPDDKSSLLLQDAIIARPKLTLTTDGASTLDITVDDHDRKLARSEAFTSRSYATLEDLGVNFELVQASKTGHQVTLTFEDAITAALRKEIKKRRWPAGTTTRREIITQLARGAQVKFSIDPDKRKPVQKLVERGGRDNSSWDLAGTLASDIQWRRFSNGKQLIAGSDEWLLERGSRKPHEITENSGPWGSVDYDLDSGKRTSEATVTVDAEWGAILAGDGVRIRDDYPATAGLWIVTAYEQELGDDTATVTLGRQRHVLKEPKRESSSGGDPGEDNFLPDRGGDPGAAGTDASTTSSANPARERMVQFALAQRGDKYAWGGNGPSEWDCSGLVGGATAAAGKPLTGASATQWSTCQAQGRAISVAAGLSTRGALLFRMGSPYNHVAISLGNGSTIEAMGTAYGVLVAGGAASRGWTGAALWL